MKKTMSVAFIGLLVMVALVMLESAAMAQTSPYTIKVPFSFNMGMQMFTADSPGFSRSSSRIWIGCP